MTRPSGFAETPVDIRSGQARVSDEQQRSEHGDQCTVAHDRFLYLGQVVCRPDTFNEATRHASPDYCWLKERRQHERGGSFHDNLRSFLGPALAARRPSPIMRRPLGTARVR
jgi:hypothetical protein